MTLPGISTAMARLEVRPAGRGRTAAWWPVVVAAVGWNLVHPRALTLSVR
ncbi:MAG: hypothetical protein ACRDN0_32360 [Trebonia sp.]